MSLHFEFIFLIGQLHHSSHGTLYETRSPRRWRLRHLHLVRAAGRRVRPQRRRACAAGHRVPGLLHLQRGLEGRQEEEILGARSVHGTEEWSFWPPLVSPKLLSIRFLNRILCGFFYSFIYETRVRNFSPILTLITNTHFLIPPPSPSLQSSRGRGNTEWVAE